MNVDAPKRKADEDEGAHATRSVMAAASMAHFTGEFIDMQAGSWRFYVSPHRIKIPASLQSEGQ